MSKIFFTALVVLIFTAELLAQRTQSPDDLFKRWDSNQDGQLSKSEIPAALRDNFSRVDADSNGTISKTEHKNFMQPQQRRPNRQVPEGLKLVKDIAYVKDGHNRQKLDLYLPDTHAKGVDGQENVKGLPVIVWVHGGGWRGGSRFPCPAAKFGLEGYAIASIGYRLTDAATFPAQIEDCKAAIAYLRSNSMKFGLDSTKFGVWGSSAGGHLVALLGTSSDTDLLNGEGNLDAKQCAVQAVCDYYGPTDLLLMQSQSGPKSRINHDAKNSPESLLVGGSLQEHPEKARAANPITYVSPQDPPFLIVHGDEDPLVPHQQSQLLHNALRKAGVESKLVLVKEGGHGPFRKPEQLERVLKFFDRHLKN